MDFNEPTARMAGSASRVLAIIGFVALIVIGMYGSVRVAQAVPGAFSRMAAAIVSITSIFVPADELITVSLPSYSVLHETPVTIAFEHKNKKVDGSYSFRYSCAAGVTLTTVAGDGTPTSITCNEPYGFAPFNNSITLTPQSTSTRFTDVEVFIAFTPSGAGTATVIGSNLMTIENQKVGSTPVTPTPEVPPAPKPKPTTPPKTTIVVPQGRASDPNGYTDLVARIIEVGTLDSAGVFTASSTPSRQFRIAVRFAIENVGTKTANKEFAFSAVLPTYPPYTHFSPMQVVLGPGDRIEYTIGFDSFDPSNTGTFMVNVDPSQSVNERDHTNNLLKHTITVTK
jgi:hypothetical protein